MSNPRVWLAVAAGLAVVATTALAAPRPVRRATPAKPAAAKASETVNGTRTMTLEQAKQTVTMLDDAYQLTLNEIHDWYPTRTGQPVVAATVLKDVQKTMGTRGWPKSRFLGVTGILMNPDHRPKDDFEKRAVKALTDGKDRYEGVEGGYFRAATVIPLDGGCFRCHWSEGGKRSRAAITWAVPLKPEPTRPR